MYASSSADDELIQNDQSTGWQLEKNVLTQPSSFMTAFLHIQTLNHFNESIICECPLSCHCAIIYSNFQITFACNKWTVINSILNRHNRTDRQSRANWKHSNLSTEKAWWTITRWDLDWNDWMIGMLNNYSMRTWEKEAILLLNNIYCKFATWSWK